MTVEVNKKRRISSKDEEEKVAYTLQHLSYMFPHDIMLDILSRLPAKSLMRFRSVSKSWNYLMRKDHFFINMHLSRSQIQLVDHEKLILANGKFNYNLCSLDYNQGSNQLERLIRHNSRLTHIRTRFDYIWGNCNGLICTGSYPKSPLYIFNSSTTEYKKVPWWKRDCESSSYCYGFGYNPNANDYIVLKLSYCGSWSGVVIYSLRSNSWKRIQKIPYSVYGSGPGQLVNGSLHWVVLSKSSKGNALLAFEITTEKFVEVPCPDDHNGIMLVSQYQGKLCFYHDKRINFSFDLWVMNKYKVKESWIKVFNIQKPFDHCLNYPICRILLCSTKDGCIVMNSSRCDDKPHLILYDPKRRTRRRILGINTWGSKVNSYVPSIVALNFNNA